MPHPACIHSHAGEFNVTEREFCAALPIERATYAALRDEYRSAHWKPAGMA